MAVFLAVTRRQETENKCKKNEKYERKQSSGALQAPPPARLSRRTRLVSAPDTTQPIRRSRGVKAITRRRNDVACCNGIYSISNSLCTYSMLFNQRPASTVCLFYSYTEHCVLAAAAFTPCFISFISGTWPIYT